MTILTTTKWWSFDHHFPPSLLMNVAVRPTPSQSVAGGGPFAAPQSQLIQQSHLNNGRQTLIALSQQNGSPVRVSTISDFGCIAARASGRAAELVRYPILIFIGQFSFVLFEA